MAVSVQRAGDYRNSDTAVGLNATGNTLAQGGYTGNSAQAKGIEDPNSPGAQAAARVAAYYNSIGQGGTPAALNAETHVDDAIAYPDSTWDKIAGDIALGAGVAGIGLLGGAVLAPELAAGLGATGASVGGAGVAGSVGTGLGAIGASAGAGLATGAATSALEGQNIGKGALLGALGGGLGAAATPVANGISGATGLPGAASTALVKAGIGGVTSAVNGANPLVGAVGAGVGSLAGFGADAAGAGAASGFIGSQIGGLAGNVVGSAIGSNGMMGQGGVAGNAGAASGGSAAANPFAQFLGGVGSIAGPILSGIGSNNISNMQTNAYTTAGNAANSGNTFGSTGLGGMGAQWANGQLNLNPGAMGGAANQFSQFANSQGGMANMFGNGGVPSNVTTGFNNFNNQIGMGQGYANAGQQSAFGVMGMGQQMLGSANANQSQAYQTALQSGQAALNPQIQQQSNALLNSNFERGMAGTSGGALQTQALQNSFNTAELQNQNQAVGQGLNAFNSTINAGQGMFNSGAGQLGNFNNQGVSFGSQGLTGSMNYNAFSPQLAGMYQSNANSGVTGFGGINTNMLNNFQAGLGAITNQGTQANRGAQTQVSGATIYNGGNAMYAGNVLGSPGSMNSLLGGAQSLFGGLTGMFGSNSGVPDYSSIFNSGGALSYGNVTGGMGMPNFDFSGIGGDATSYAGVDPSMFGGG